MINTSNNKNRVRVIWISRRKMHFWEGRRIRTCNERKIQHSEDRKRTGTIFSLWLPLAPGAHRYSNRRMRNSHLPTERNAVV